MPSEVISIHIGQAGVSIGDASWELYCLEHGIEPDGQNPTTSKAGLTLNNTFFSETLSGLRVPNALFLDTESSAVDNIRTGPYSRLFPENHLICGSGVDSELYARGYYTEGRKIIGAATESIRKLAEQCAGLQGFLIFHSFGGGTGSGFTSLLMKHLYARYELKTRLQFAIFPSPTMCSTVVEPYNSILTTHASLKYSEGAILIDNEAVRKRCIRCLDITLPTYTNWNRLISQAVSCITASLRFDGALNVDLSDIRTNLMPYPRLQFPIVSYAPVLAAGKVYRDTPSASVAGITNACFDRECQLMTGLHPGAGRFMACCLLYRGDVVTKDVNAAIEHVKNIKAQHFVNWCPTGFKVGMNCHPMTDVPGGEMQKAKRTLCALCNTTSISGPLNSLNKNFDRMFAKRDHLHRYLSEGMEESELLEAREDVELLTQEYENTGLAGSY